MEVPALNRMKFVRSRASQTRSLLNSTERKPIMAKQPGLDDRHRDKGGQTREKNSNTRIDTLREIYGPDFAPGLRGDAHLRTLLDRTDSDSLSDYLKKHKR
jgi:hypothetical protein